MIIRRYWSMKLYLIRQVETQGIAQGRYGYNGDLDLLTPRGQQQLTALKDFFKDKRVYQAFASPKQSCNSTAKAVHAMILGTVMELEDVDTGLFTGLTSEEAHQKFPDEARKREEDVFNYPFLQGESYSSIAPKVLNWFHTLRFDDEANYAIITHLGPLLILLQELEGKTFDEVKHMFFAPGSITTVTREGEKWVVEELNKELVEADDLKEKMSHD